MAPKTLVAVLGLWNIKVFGKNSSFVFAVQLGLAFWVFLVSTDSMTLLGSHLFLVLDAVRAMFQYLEVNKREQESLMEYFVNIGRIIGVTFIVSWIAEIAGPALTGSLGVAGIIFRMVYYTSARNLQSPFFENWPIVAMSTLSVIAIGTTFLQRIFTSVICCFSGLEAAITTARQSRRKNASSGPYRYTPIEAERQIRLLKIPRRRIFSAMSCELITVSLDDCPAFQAMSYTWGGEQPSVQVIVDDMQLKITSTVADMLHYQCSLYGSRCLWIDAVCINQMDADERGQQVHLMGDIFGKASGVVAWLGPMGNAKNPHLACLMLYFITVWRVLSSDGPRAWLVEHKPIHLPALDPLWDIVDHPFFERMWIIQEVSVAKRVQILHGHTCLSWDLFASSAKILHDSQYLPLTAGKEIMGVGMEVAAANRMRLAQRSSNARNIGIIRRCTANQGQPSLGELLPFCMYFQAKDPRDMIFALLGLSFHPCHEDLTPEGRNVWTDLLWNDLTPNYNKPVAEVYATAMRYIVSYPGRYPILLHLAGIGYKRSPDLDLLGFPSWTVDFRCMDKTFLGNISKYEISAWAADHVLTENKHILRFRISQEDAISIIASGNYITMDSATKSESVDDPLDFIFNAHAEAIRYYKGDMTKRDLYQALWETLCTPAWLLILECSNMQISLDDFINSMAFIQALLPALKSLKPKPSIMLRFYISHLLPRDLRKMFHNVITSVLLNCVDKRFAITEKGRMALLPPYSREGDLVCQIKGLQGPFLMRRTEKSGVYQLVGSCYVRDLACEEDAQDWETCYVE